MFVVGQLYDCRSGRGINIFCHQMALLFRKTSRMHGARKTQTGGGHVDEKERIRERIRETVSGDEERDYRLELLEEAFRGLEEKLSRGVAERIEEMLNKILREMEKTADKIKEML